TLDDEHVLLELVSMLGRGAVCHGSPEGNLAPVRSIEQVPIDVIGELRRPGDAVQRVLDEGREVGHCLLALTPDPSPERSPQGPESALTALFGWKSGDPTGNRTRVTGVRGRCPNR